MAWWFRQKYSLPPTDPRFLDATTEQMLVDYWANYYSLRPGGEEFEDDDFDLEAEIAAMNAKPESKPHVEPDPDDWVEVAL